MEYPTFCHHADGRCGNKTGQGSRRVSVPNRAQPGSAGDDKQRPLRSRYLPHLTPSVRQQPTKVRNVMPTSPQCKSCQYIENPTNVVGGVLPAGKGSRWRVNHYQSVEAILGWLALQPVEHQPTLDTLSDETLDDLGSALRSVQKAMKRVWTEQFPDDPLVRIHTVNFMEREFDQPKPQDSFHVHIFLIPRSKLLGEVIREQLKEASEKQYVAWHDYKIFQRIKCQDSSDLLEKDVPWNKLQRYINADREGRKDLDDKIENFMNRFRQTMTKSQKNR